MAGIFERRWLMAASVADNRGRRPCGGGEMPRYILLVDWTDQGVEAVEETVDRLEHGSELGEAFGCEIEHVWWTQGGHDMVSVINAPDEQAMVAYTLAIVRLGNLRTTTLRAWTADEMRQIVGRLPR
jgi:uncharacterized protein with GYD domain